MYSTSTSAFGAAAPATGEPERRALAYLFLFRRIVPVLALLAAGVGWVEQIPWLVAAGLAVGIGEWLETSYYISVLRWGEHRDLSRLP